MKFISIILLFITSYSSCQKKNSMQQMPGIISSTQNGSAGNKKFTYLALGDSYSIGHNVPATENYPNQTKSLLEKNNRDVTVKIIATTGWTTQDLKAALTDEKSTYDVVTLLIGVNNEYQGQPAENYEPEFDELLKTAIARAGNKKEHVIVISIPDWSVTPFASGRDRNKIAKEIDEYNSINKAIAARYDVMYLDITPWTREAAQDETLLTSDGLHPSGKEYARWAAALAAMMINVLK